MITFERLVEVLDYDPGTGIFTWKIRVSRKCTPGKQAGSLKTSGYLIISIDKAFYRAHQLAWLYMTRAWPLSFLDHKDNLRSNNRWTNLRLATKTENNRNSKRRINNSTGIKGVSRIQHSDKFRARIGHQHLGRFTTIQEASAAVREARQRLHGEFANNG